MASQMWLVGQATHEELRVSKWRGGLQVQCPEGVAMVLGGQQILEGPVGAVPVGQTHWRVFVLKSIPAGQQGKWTIASWLRARHEPKASRVNREMTNLLIKIFSNYDAPTHLFDLNKKH